MKKIKIYALVDPWDGTIFYIGKSNNPEKRKHTHFALARRDTGRNMPLNKKIREVEAKGRRLVDARVIYYCDASSANKKEAEFIYRFIKEGHPLLNIQHGRKAKEQFYTEIFARSGGLSTSESKTAASRINGKKGGRPKGSKNK